VKLGFLPQDRTPPAGNPVRFVILGASRICFGSRGASDEQQTAGLADVGLSLSRRVSHDAIGRRTTPGGDCTPAGRPVIYLLDEPTNHLDPAQQLGFSNASCAHAQALP
jgi:ABC-type cobalamin/Fe3+-siderophores transport system ATPase subunit